jgi:hypothetical protein
VKAAGSILGIALIAAAAAWAVFHWGGMYVFPAMLLVAVALLISRVRPRFGGRRNRK